MSQTSLLGRIKLESIFHPSDFSEASEVAFSHALKTALVAKDQTVSFIYRMRQFGGDWRVIDILLDGSISQLSVYRSDFAATLKSGGAQALVKKIDGLADKALKG